MGGQRRMEMKNNNGINSMEWVDRERCANIDTLCTCKNKIKILIKLEFILRQFYSELD